MFELGIVGGKNAGKTTLIETLLPELTSHGLRVGTIKHSSHRHTFDTEGKDSYRHRAAGAFMTMAVSEGELALFSGDTALAETITAQLMAAHCDMCLVEGDRTTRRPKVFLTRGLSESDAPLPDQIIASYGPEALTDGIPHFALDDITGLALFIIQQIPARRAT
ncbi:MAG: molybdopterin-guanine dinucleotide biosynthesis protein B [Candidatus Zixiibacteriota bacterium]|nr:MAG: molybdopterin-guanine dinucleotide biosynthesis protein B [candidate division Zixibacteria bacterium]